MRRGYVDTALGQVHYRAEGDGPLVVLLHAANHSARQFRRFIPHLSGDYRVVAPDLVGFGNSDPPPADVTIPGIAECIVEVIDAFDADRAHVFGLHTGNKVGAAMGARESDRVDKLLLCGLPHSIIPDDARRNEAARDVVAETLVEFPATEDGSHRLKEWGHWHRKITDAWWDTALLRGEGTAAADVESLADRVIATLQLRPSVRDVYAANFAYELSADLRRLSVETHFIELAEPGEIEEYGHQVDRLTEIAPSSTATVIEGATATDFVTAPATIAEPTLEFFGD